VFCVGANVTASLRCRLAVVVKVCCRLQSSRPCSRIDAYRSSRLPIKDPRGESARTGEVFEAIGLRRRRTLSNAPIRHARHVADQNRLSVAGQRKIGCGRTCRQLAAPVGSERIVAFAGVSHRLLTRITCEQKRRSLVWSARPILVYVAKSVNEQAFCTSRAVAYDFSGESVLAQNDLVTPMAARRRCRRKPVRRHRRFRSCLLDGTHVETIWHVRCGRFEVAPFWVVRACEERF